MTTRRSFLQIMGLSGAAAPLAAKAASDKAIAEMAGVFPLGPGTPIGVGMSMPPTAVGGNDWKAKVLRFIARNTLPDWLEEELRWRHRTVGYLDPDIAAKRSWSMNVKIITQRERNIARAKQEALEGPRRSLRNREFEDQYGIWL